jgi:hypothetical protein
MEFQFMKYRRDFIILLSLLMILAIAVTAQQPAKIKRPVKNPPQYTNIIDLEEKDQSPKQNQPLTPQTQGELTAEQPDNLANALGSLTTEVRTLVQELRSLNLRQQAQLDMLRMTRVDMRIDHYERELRPVRERISALEVEEQTLYQLMTRDSLLAQTAQIGTVNREQTMNQIKLTHEAKLRYVQDEKERMRKVEKDLIASLSIYQNQGSETERRIQATEEILRQIETTKGNGKDEPGKTERKP